MVEEKSAGGMPLKPKQSFENFRSIDEELGTLVGGFWGLVWGKPDSAIEQKTKLLLSLANAVGAKRMRQATRELIKAYSLGCSTREMDELFAIFIWNQGVGNFASEIGPSALFSAYQLIKKEEKTGTSKQEILNKLKNNFGENNPGVSVRSKS